MKTGTLVGLPDPPVPPGEPGAKGDKGDDVLGATIVVGEVPDNLDVPVITNAGTLTNVINEFSLALDFGYSSGPQLISFSGLPQEIPLDKVMYIVGAVD